MGSQAAAIKAALTSSFFILLLRICMFFFKFAFFRTSRRIPLWSKTVLERAPSIVQFPTLLINVFEIQKKLRRERLVF